MSLPTYLEQLISFYDLDKTKLDIKEDWLINDFSDEQIFQAKTILMISQQFPQFRGKVWHTKNEGYIPRKEKETDEEYDTRRKIEGARNKAQGMMAGVMDILIRYNGILYEIELKQPKGYLSDKQKEVHEEWSKDCPKKPPITAWTMAEVYIYCKKILKDSWMINFREEDKDNKIFDLMIENRKLKGQVKQLLKKLN